MSKYDQLREMRERSSAPRTTSGRETVPAARLAQLVEQPPRKRKVEGSTPSPGANLVSLLDGSAYAGVTPFSHAHYNAWYQKHIYRPRKRLQ